MLDQDVIFSHSDELLAQVDDFELSKFAIIYVVFSQDLQFIGILIPYPHLT